MKSLPILDLSRFRDTGETDGFYCNRLRPHLRDHHHDIHLPHKHDSYLVVLFTRGSGTHEVDFNSYPVKPGSIFLLNPGQTHHWELTDDVDGFIFLHSRNFIDLYYSDKTVDSFPFFFSVKNEPVIYLKKEIFKNTESLFSEILKEYTQDKVLKYQKLRSLVDLLYIELSRSYVAGTLQKTARAGSYVSQLKEFEMLIDKHYPELKSPAAYAEKLHISNKHLNRITQTLLGKTSSELITERVMLEAKRMLLHAGNSISEIAAFLGYDDYSYFSRLFKKHCGETPSAFVKRYH